MLVSSCSSSDGPPLFNFALEDCHGALVEVARLPMTYTVDVNGAENNLAIDGDTLYMTYAFANSQTGLGPDGGIVAIPVSGGAVRMVATGGRGAAFWTTGGQIHVQTGSAIVSVPENPATPVTVSAMPSPALYGAYAHDAEFGYSALANADK